MTSPSRYHLLLTFGGRPVQHGWWWSETVARHKFVGWVGEYASMSEPRVTLTDEDTGTTLTTWPEQS
jgi:hypothetical protein